MVEILLSISLIFISLSSWGFYHLYKSEKAKDKSISIPEIEFHVEYLQKEIEYFRARDKKLVSMYIELTDKVIMGKTDRIQHGPLSQLKAVQPPLGSRKTH